MLLYNDTMMYILILSFRKWPERKKQKFVKTSALLQAEIENLFLFLFFKESHHVTPASLELTRWTRLALNLQLSPFLCLQSTENKGMHDYTYLETKFSILISQF